MDLIDYIDIISVPLRSADTAEKGDDRGQERHWDDERTCVKRGSLLSSACLPMPVCEGVQIDCCLKSPLS